MNDSKRSNGMGIAIGVFIWGICFLGLPKFVNLSGWLAYILYGIGFLLLLIGIMGICIEAANSAREFNARQDKIQQDIDNEVVERMRNLGKMQ
jgi:hypothetical protein